jgi:hypothetical protein
VEPLERFHSEWKRSSSCLSSSFNGLRSHRDSGQADIALAPLPPLTPLERRSFDYSGLDAAMVFADGLCVVRAGCSRVSGTPVATASLPGVARRKRLKRRWRRAKQETSEITRCESQLRSCAAPPL